MNVKICSDESRNIPKIVIEELSVARAYYPLPPLASDFLVQNKKNRQRKYRVEQENAVIDFS